MATLGCPGRLRLATDLPQHQVVLGFIFLLQRCQGILLLGDESSAAMLVR